MLARADAHRGRPRLIAIHLDAYRCGSRRKRLEWRAASSRRADRSRTRARLPASTALSRLPGSPARAPAGADGRRCAQVERRRRRRPPRGQLKRPLFGRRSRRALHESYTIRAPDRAARAEFFPARVRSRSTSASAGVDRISKLPRVGSRLRATAPDAGAMASAPAATARAAGCAGSLRCGLRERRLAAHAGGRSTVVSSTPRLASPGPRQASRDCRKNPTRRTRRPRRTPRNTATIGQSPALRVQLTISGSSARGGCADQLEPRAPAAGSSGSIDRIKRRHDVSSPSDRPSVRRLMVGDARGRLVREVPVAHACGRRLEARRRLAPRRSECRVAFARSAASERSAHAIALRSSRRARCSNSSRLSLATRACR